MAVHDRNMNCQGRAGDHGMVSRMAPFSGDVQRAAARRLENLPDGGCPSREERFGGGSRGGK